MIAVLKQEIFGKTGLSVSRLGLGTAEIGFAYGLGTSSLPSEEEAIKLLRTAVELGVTFFDTANYYGLAEERIGKSGILKDSRVVVCTKCAQFLEKGEYFEPKELERRIREQVEGSLHTLKLETLSILLIHGPSAEQLREGTLVLIVTKLHREGKIRHWGVSTRGEEAPLAAIECGADVVEVAYSIADRRMTPIFAASQKNHVGVINRSVYLKGAFAGKADYLGERQVKLKRAAAVAEKVAGDSGMTVTELALRYTLSEPAIAVSLIGTSNVVHLKAAYAAMKNGPLSRDTIDALSSLAIDDPDEVDPARWN